MFSTYDGWKLATPPEYEFMGPDPQDEDDGKSAMETRFVTCPECDGSGEIPIGVWVHEPGCGYGHMADDAITCTECGGSGKSEQEVKPIKCRDLYRLTPAESPQITRGTGPMRNERDVSENGWTPGPWRWEVNPKARIVQLCGGKPQYDLTVMDFVRWGMSRAAPRFLESNGRWVLLDRCEKWLEIVPGREHHKDWFQTLNHPDANLIAAAPALAEALEEVRQWIDAVSDTHNFNCDRAFEIIDAALSLAKHGST